MKQYVRDLVVRLVREEILAYINDHEEDLIRIFNEELRTVDARNLNKHSYIDIHLAVMGEELMQAVLQTVRRFLNEVERKE